MTTITEYQTDIETMSGSNLNLIIAQTGTISVIQSSGMQIAAVDESGSDNSLTVMGSIWQFPGSNHGGFGVRSSGANFTLAVAKGGFIQGNSGAEIDGSNAQVINNGTISGFGFSSFGVSIGGGSIENHGTISGLSSAIDVTRATAIVNDGSILSSNDGIQMNVLTTDALTVTNHGVIHANAAISSSDGNDKIVNEGVIIGGIFLNDGKDVVDTRGGTIKGEIFTGDGNDTLITDNAKITLSEDDTSQGGLDTVKSTVNYTLNANVEVLQLIGKSNINGTGTDTNVGREYLNGNSDNNTLSGLGGNDVLDGGAGKDTLFGGTGLDLFVFKKGYGVDTVQDFHHNDGDLIIVDGVSDYSQIENKLEKHGKDTWLNMGHGDILVLHHININNLDHTDFGL